MDSDRIMTNKVVNKEVSRNATGTSLIPPSAPTYQVPTITVSSAEKGILWQEPQVGESQETEPENVKNFLCIRILITMATTFVLISIIPILLIDLLPSPEVALPLLNTPSGSGIVRRSFPLDSRSGNSTWNYTKLCEPREGKCQFGTYSTKHHPSNRTLLWLDEGCEEIQFKAYCPRCPEETTWVLDTALLPGSVSSPDTPFFPFQLLVKFPHPDNFTDIPSIIYYEKESSRHGMMVGSWYSPDSDLEFFSLLWLDCFAGLDVN